MRSSYLSYGSGQKAGGINVSAGAAKKAGYDTLVLKPETTRNVELGIQGTLLDGRLRWRAVAQQRLQQALIHTAGGRQHGQRLCR
jgi:outer membrane receptor protein involved in Fe transport